MRIKKRANQDLSEQALPSSAIELNEQELALVTGGWGGDHGDHNHEDHNHEDHNHEDHDHEDHDHEDHNHCGCN